MTLPASRRLTHAYIVSPAAQAKDERVMELAAALVCRENGKPCGICRDCRKAFGGVHPDITVVSRGEDERGKPRREIYVDQIRELISGAQLMPNEADRRVFIIEDADLMNGGAQNALLKILEEPPGNAAFILCAERPEALLPTVRSRCALLSGVGRAAEYSPEAEELAAAFADVWLSGGTPELLRFCAANEGAKREVLTEFLECAKAVFAARLRQGAGAGAIEAIRLLGTASLYAKQNVGSKHIWGLLSVNAPGLPTAPRGASAPNK